MSGGRRSLDEVAATLGRWGRHHWPDRSGVDVTDLRRASAGHSNETLFASVLWDGGTRAEDVVVRLPPLAPSFPDRDVLAEARLLEALAGAEGAPPVPAPIAVEEDPTWFGAPFVVLPVVPGRAPGEVLAFDEWLVDGGEPVQAALHRSLVGALAAIHQVPLDVAWPTPASASSGSAAGAGSSGSASAAGSPSGGSPLTAEVQRWGRYLAWAAGDDPVDPGLAEAMAWVVAHQPPVEDEPAPSLTWGDARYGNLLVDEATAAVVAVLDWELAVPGPAELDLGWFLALDELQARFVGSTLPGFPDRAGTIAAWESAIGRPARDLEWHEIFALVRSTAIADHQARLAVAAGEPPAYGDGNPMVRWIQRKISRLV